MDCPALEELPAYMDWTRRQYEATIHPLGDEAGAWLRLAGPSRPHWASSAEGITRATSKE